MNAPVRRFKRCKVDIRAKIRRLEEPEDSAVVVRTYEMSEGGMSVYAPETLEAGSLLVVEFSLPGSDELLRLESIVRNRRGFRCGMEFMDPTMTERSQIARYLGSLVDVIEI
jgi:c-di-GMP-binding flagellar brake protein YcgR